jgi:hypothetical protein
MVIGQVSRLLGRIGLICRLLGPYLGSLPLFLLFSFPIRATGFTPTGPPLKTRLGSSKELLTFRPWFVADGRSGQIGWMATKLSLKRITL